MGSCLCWQAGLAKSFEESRLIVRISKSDQPRPIGSPTLYIIFVGHARVGRRKCPHFGRSGLGRRVTAELGIAGCDPSRTKQAPALGLAEGCQRLFVSPGDILGHADGEQAVIRGERIEAHGLDGAGDTFRWPVAEGEEISLTTDIMIVVRVQLERLFDMHLRQFVLAAIVTGGRDGVASRAVGFFEGDGLLCQRIGAFERILGCFRPVRLVLVEIADRQPCIGRGVIGVERQRLLEVAARFEFAVFRVAVQALAAPKQEVVRNQVLGGFSSRTA